MHIHIIIHIYLYLQLIHMNNVLTPANPISIPPTHKSMMSS